MLIQEQQVGDKYRPQKMCAGWRNAVSVLL
jgi:hypothetical protein